MSKSIYSTMSMYDLHLIEKTVLEKGDVENVLKNIMKSHNHDEKTDGIAFCVLDMADIGFSLDMVSSNFRERIKVVESYSFCSMIVSK